MSKRSKSVKRTPRRAVPAPAEDRLQATFNYIDKDFSETIDAHELAVYFSILGWKSEQAREQAKQLIKTADVNNDSKIDFAEFKRICLACDIEGHDIPQPPTWRMFVQNTFGSKTATTLSEQVAGARALKDSVQAFASPLQSLVRRSSIERGTAPTLSFGKRKAPCFSRVCSHFLEACFCVPFVAVLILLLFSPFSYAYSDDVYRLAKNGACTAYQGVDIRNHDPALHRRLEAFCDPHDGCPEFYSMLNLSHSEQNTRTIKRACRKLSAMYHPDRACSPAKLKERGEAIDACEERVSAYFECVTEARDTLLNPEKRQYYDKYGNLDPQEHAMHDFFIVGTAFVAFCISWVLSLFVLAYIQVESVCCAGQSCGQFMLGVAVVYDDGQPVGCLGMLLRLLLKIWIAFVVVFGNYVFGTWWIHLVILGASFWVYLRLLSHFVVFKIPRKIDTSSFHKD
jgi:hypothetical protein